MCFKGLPLHYTDIVALLEHSPSTDVIIDHFGFFLQGKPWYVIIQLIQKKIMLINFWMSKCWFKKKIVIAFSLWYKIVTYISVYITVFIEQDHVVMTSIAVYQGLLIPILIPSISLSFYLSLPLLTTSSILLTPLTSPCLQLWSYGYH